MAIPSSKGLEVTVGSGVEGRIREGGQALGLELEDRGVDRLVSYLSLVQKWSSIIRLVGEDSESALVLHILDSLAVARLRLPQGTLVDIGSGAGFPGVPLAALDPDRPVILVESRERRAAFLKEVTRLLKLDNVSVRPGRFEDIELPSDVLAIGRAVAPPERFLRMVEGRGVRDAVLMINESMLRGSYLSGWVVDSEDRPPLPYTPQHVNLLCAKRQ